MDERWCGWTQHGQVPTTMPCLADKGLTTQQITTMSARTRGTQSKRTPTDTVVEEEASIIGSFHKQLLLDIEEIGGLELFDKSIYDANPGLYGAAGSKRRQQVTHHVQYLKTLEKKGRSKNGSSTSSASLPTARHHGELLNTSGS